MAETQTAKAGVAPAPPPETGALAPTGPRELSYERTNQRGHVGVVDQETGEMIEEAWRSDAMFAGISAQRVTEQQAKILMAPPAYEELEIKPDTFGAVYLSHGRYRDRLNKAFGPMAWGMRPIGPIVRDAAAGMVYREYALYIEGRFAGQAIGEQAWLGSTGGGMTWGDAIEGAKSNALIRCCKDLGIAVECWDRRFVAEFRRKACISVFVERQTRDGLKTTTAWRRLDDEPMLGELGVTETSPNKDKYAAPPPPYWRRQKGPAQQGTTAPAAQPSKPATQQPPPTQPTAATGVDRRPISEPQVKRLWTIVRKRSGWSDEDAAKEITKRWGYTSSTSITRADYKAICDFFERGGTD